MYFFWRRKMTTCIKQFLTILIVHIFKWFQLKLWILCETILKCFGKYFQFHRVKWEEKIVAVHTCSTVKMWFNSFYFNSGSRCHRRRHCRWHITKTITYIVLYFHFNAVTISTNYDQSLRTLNEQCAIFAFYIYLHFRNWKVHRAYYTTTTKSGE